MKSADGEFAGRHCGLEVVAIRHVAPDDNLRGRTDDLTVGVHDPELRRPGQFPARAIQKRRAGVGRSGRHLRDEGERLQKAAHAGDGRPELLSPATRDVVGPDMGRLDIARALSQEPGGDDRGDRKDDKQDDADQAELDAAERNAHRPSARKSAQPVNRSVKQPATKPHRHRRPACGASQPGTGRNAAGRRAARAPRQPLSVARSRRCLRTD